MKPIGNRVLILPTDQDSEEISPGGIVLIKKDIPPSTRGRVVSVGPKAEAVLKVGDNVQYGQHSGHEIEWEDKTHLIMKDSDIICIL